MPCLGEHHEFFCRGQWKRNYETSWCKQRKIGEVQSRNDASDERGKSSSAEIRGRQYEPEIIDLTDDWEKTSLKETEGRQPEPKFIDLDTDPEDDAENVKEQETWQDHHDKKGRADEQPLNDDLKEFVSRIVRMVWNEDETQTYQRSVKSKTMESCSGKPSREHALKKLVNLITSELYEPSVKRRLFASENTERIVHDDSTGANDCEDRFSSSIAQGTISNEYFGDEEINLPQKRRVSSGADVLFPRKLRKVANVKDVYEIVNPAVNSEGDASLAPINFYTSKKCAANVGNDEMGCDGQLYARESDNAREIKSVEKDAVKAKDVRESSSAPSYSSEESAERMAIGTKDIIRYDASVKLKEILRVFNSYYLRFVQEEEVRCGRESSVMMKNSPSPMNSERKKLRRPDLKAITQMKADKTIVNVGKFLGNVPGIKVGDQFFSRCEMIAIGLHRHWLSGIDTITESSKNKKLILHKKTGEVTPIKHGTCARNNIARLPIASSIILSGAYEDDIDNAEDVIYTGQGGNDLLGNKRQIADQVLKRGNLALKNNMEQDIPVRLIRGHKTKYSYTGKVYTYDGLYKVRDYWAEKGISGFTVYKFRLKRVEGQPVLTTDQVHFVSRQIPTAASELKGLVCADISHGLEDLPIPASNIYDSTIAPEVRYIARVEVKKGVQTPRPAMGCNCIGECIDTKKCSCAILNGRRFPYVKQNGGRLIEPMDVVYECGPHCGCSKSCSNRVTQKGMQYRLEVFQTANKGWGVRSWDTIPAGAPVCKYSGTLMRYEDADKLSDSQYILELDCLQTMKGIGGRQRRLVSNVGIHSSFNDVPEQPEYCIDSSTCGNVSRFINHSCEPNLFIQCVLSEHHDLRQPHIWFFAADTIPPLRELTYDYGYELDSVVKDGKVKVLPCLCGASSCRKRLY